MTYLTPLTLKLVGFAILMAAGQILFKQASIGSEPLHQWRAIVALFMNPWFLIALVLYGIATLLWVDVLRNVELSRAYPFIALGFVLVPLAGAAFFGEPLDARYFFGMVLILGGIFLTFQG